MHVSISPTVPDQFKGGSCRSFMSEEDKNNRKRHQEPCFYNEIWRCLEEFLRFLQAVLGGLKNSAKCLQEFQDLEEFYSSSGWYLNVTIPLPDATKLIFVIYLVSVSSSSPSLVVKISIKVNAF